MDSLLESKTVFTKCHSLNTEQKEGQLAQEKVIINTADAPKPQRSVAQQVHLQGVRGEQSRVGKAPRTVDARQGEGGKTRQFL